jgi:3alpha(or 20beta)-hydroxysteroid dehydrogenase
MKRLEGKVALITGGARGQGEAEARRFVAEGARVVIADVLDDAGRRVAAELGDAARFQHLDVTSKADWQAAVQATLAQFGRLDILVNNAAILKLVPIESCSLDDYRKVIDVNQVGCWLGMKTAVAALKDAGGGSIVNVSSTAGMEGVAGGSAYVSSKFAVRGMTKAAALEFGRYGIRVNSVHPGGITTPMTAGLPKDRYDDQLIPRQGTPAEVTALVVFLAAEATFSTGSEWVIDGGAAMPSSKPLPPDKD